MSKNVHNEYTGKDVENPISNDSTRNDVAVEITEINNQQISEKQQKISELLLPSEKQQKISELPISSEKQQGISKDNESTFENDAEVKKEGEVHITEKLNNLHCPFVWQADLHIKSYGDNDFDLLTEAEDMFEETGFRFRSFIKNLILCYHHFYKRLIEECLQNLIELERILYRSSKHNSHDHLFNRINEALFHVIHSCRLYIMLCTDQKSHMSLLLKKIEPYDSMNNANKAGIWGIRASVYVEYGYEGVKAAVDYIQNAIDLDRFNPFWHFMKGIYLGRLRRMEDTLTMPSMNEIRALEYALKIRVDPAFLAFTAEVYLEIAKIVMKLYKEKRSNNPHRIIEQLYAELDLCNQKAAEYFKRSVELKPECAHLLFRCGKGLMRLPPPYQDLEAAENYLRKGLEISPGSSFGNHAMAMFFEKYKQDFRLVEKYLVMSVDLKNFQAHMDLFRIKFLETENFKELIVQLKNMLKMYTDLPQQRKLCGDIVCYYLFIDYNLPEACEYMKTLLSIRTKFSDGQKFKSSIYPFSNEIPLQDILLSEVSRRYKQKNTPVEEKDVYKKFVDFLETENIEVMSSGKIAKNLFSIYAEELEKAMKRTKKERKNFKEEDAATEITEDITSKLHVSVGNSKMKEFYKYYRTNEEAKSTISSILLKDSEQRNGINEDQLLKARKQNEVTHRLDDRRRADVRKNVSTRKCDRFDVEKSYSLRKLKQSSECSSSKSDSYTSYVSDDEYKTKKYYHRRTRESRKKHQYRSPSTETSSAESSRNSGDDENFKSAVKKKVYERDGKESRVHKQRPVSDEIPSIECGTSNNFSIALIDSKRIMDNRKKFHNSPSKRSRKHESSERSAYKSVVEQEHIAKVQRKSHDRRESRTLHEKRHSYENDFSSDDNKQGKHSSNRQHYHEVDILRRTKKNDSVSSDSELSSGESDVSSCRRASSNVNRMREEQKKPLDKNIKASKCRRHGSSRERKVHRRNVSKREVKKSYSCDEYTDEDSSTKSSSSSPRSISRRSKK